jgi:hypothetical protein
MQRGQGQSMKLTPKNWNTFQHYKDRAPAWIKLHKGLLDDYQFQTLPVASRALAPCLWLLASEYEGGEITATLDEIAFRLRMSRGELSEAIHPLIESKFFTIDSDLLAEPEQVAIPEKEEEREIQEEKEIESCAVAKATRPKHSIEFEEFWKAYPRRQGANPKTPAFKAFDAAVKAGADPDAISAGARRCAIADRDKIGTPFIPQAVKWLRDRRWEDYTVATYYSDQPTALLTITPADRNWNAWKSHFRDSGKNGIAAIMDKCASDGKPYTVQSEWPPGMAA